MAFSGLAKLTVTPVTICVNDCAGVWKHLVFVAANVYRDVNCLTGVARGCYCVDFLFALG